MILKGEIDMLQEALAKKLASMSDLATADIKAEGSKIFEHGAGKACGVSMTVKIPIPLTSSKYAAGPVFSKVAVQILIERDKSLALHSPSIAALAEHVTKAFYNWKAPLSCGYGKLSINEQKPWTQNSKEGEPVSSLSVNFIAQSVLE